MFMKCLPVFFIISATVFDGISCEKCAYDIIEQSTSKVGRQDGKYVLKIEGMPEHYVPNKKYGITLTVDMYTSQNIIYQQFRKFVVTLDSHKRPQDSPDLHFDTGRLDTGEDNLSKFSEVCRNTLVEVNFGYKKKVHFFWNAPPPSSGCVTIRAVVIETMERWWADPLFSNDGFLTKTLCEDLNDDEDAQPEVLPYCCACQEAKYELAFQGNWIRNTHPKDFPKDEWKTRFSDLIGAAHKANQAFWEENSPPSEGLKEMVKTENVQKLELELMGNYKNIRTIIKARGLEPPNIRDYTYAIFRMDYENHLVSVVSRMVPSPDWIVGVSNFELCLPNCTWKQSRTINLYPKDIGIDDGVTYTESLPNWFNRDARVSSLVPTTDEKSPFYNEDGEGIPPVAKLHFRLMKVFKNESCDPEKFQKQLESELQNPEEGGNDEEDKDENEADKYNRLKSFNQVKTIKFIPKPNPNLNLMDYWSKNANRGL